MKKLLACIQFLLLSLTASATALDADVIYINDSLWALMGKPIEADKALFQDLKAAIPKKTVVSTANWDGFVAYWSINRDVLYLDSVRYYPSDAYKAGQMEGELLDNDTLIRVFAKYVQDARIVASWVNRDIRVASGKVVYYVHDAFKRNLEEEKILSINNGRVIAKKEYHNFVIDGFSFDSMTLSMRLNDLFPLHVERYPELKGLRRISFHVKHAKVDPQGYLVECEVDVSPRGLDPRIAEEMVGLLKAHHPWKVSFINGEYRPAGIEGWSHPYHLDK